MTITTEDEILAIRKRNRIARNLLKRALNAIPDYVDGRNDRLCASIEKWLIAQSANRKKKQ